MEELKDIWPALGWLKGSLAEDVMPAEADAEQALDPAAYVDRVMKKSSAGSGASTADTTSLQAELDKWAGFLLKEPNDKYLVGKRDAASAALAAAKDAVPTPERSVTSRSHFGSSHFGSR